MRIESNRSSKVDNIKKKSAVSTSGGGEFDGLLSVGDSGSTSPASYANSIGSINSIFSVQEMSIGIIDPEEAKEKGLELLDELKKLRNGIVMEQINIQSLQHLLNKIQNEKIHVADPKLQEIVDDIETRASVELAKLGKI
jgi:hypothetical protein